MRSTWTDEELRELISLWPVSSATQIAKRLRRSRASVCRKAERLRQDGVALPRGDVAKHFEVPPRKPRSPRARPKTMAAKSPSPLDDAHAMRPCSLIELNQWRCHWPLGDPQQPDFQFCGGRTEPGCPYCAGHLWMASKSSEAVGTRG